MPRRCCTLVAVAGKVWSGVVVATTQHVDIGPAEAGVMERLLGGMDGQIRGQLAGRRDMALVDAGALGNPLIRSCRPAWPAPRW